MFFERLLLSRISNEISSKFYQVRDFRILNRICSKNIYTTITLNYNNIKSYNNYIKDIS